MMMFIQVLNAATGDGWDDAGVDWDTIDMWWITDKMPLRLSVTLISNKDQT